MSICRNIYAFILREMKFASRKSSVLHQSLIWKLTSCIVEKITGEEN